MPSGVLLGDRERELGHVDRLGPPGEHAQREEGKGGAREEEPEGTHGMRSWEG